MNHNGARYRARRGIEMLPSLNQQWKGGQEIERIYWDNLLTPMLPQKPHDDYFDERVGGSLKFHFQSLVAYVTSSTIRAIDVGAGPVALVGASRPSQQIDITAVDPLAEFYDEFLGEIGVVRPIPTIPGDSEPLQQFFTPNTCDLAFSGNALDHCSDPPSVISQVFGVLKPECHFCLCGNPNESEQ